MNKLLILNAILVVGFLHAQNDMRPAQIDSIAMHYANTITQEDLKGHLSILASDALEGRETGKRGQKMAAAYISSHFKELGLKAPVTSEYGNSYYQPVDLKYYVFSDTYVVANGEKLYIGERVYYKGTAFNSGEVKTEAVFGGSGSVKELNSINFKGKSVVIINENRRQRDATLKHIKQHGGKMLFAVSSISQKEFETSISKTKYIIKKPKIGLATSSKIDETGIFYIGPDVISKVFNTPFSSLQEAINGANEGKFKSLSKIKAIDLSYKLDFTSTNLSSENVLGYLEGTDLKDEVIVITAHYDHEGVKNGLIYNGADDDGSGTSAVLDIAEAFALAKAEGNGPRRSILFMTVTGEEKGLLGSKYYTNNPIFSLENTVTNLNIDMIGRRGFDHLDDDNYVYVIGADRLSKELHNINENANSLYTKMELDYTYNDENDKNRFYYRSDHYNFAKNNIPIIFYFNGVHEDYHKPTDTVDKIEFVLMTKRTKLVFYTAWEVANRDVRLELNEKQEEKASR